MKRVILIINLLILPLLFSCKQIPDSSHVVFFRPSKKISEHYESDKIYPQGKIFPYSGFSLNKQVLKGNFTIAGPVYTDNNEFLKEAESSGKKAIYSIRAENVTHKVLEETQEIDFDKITKSIKKQVSSVAGNRTIAWWYLTPEELRHWKKNELKYLETATRAVRESDPLKRPVWMYDPGHRNASSLARTCKYLDICGKGMYVNYSEFKDSRIFCRWTIEQEIEAIKISNPAAIPIAVPEMFQEPEPENVKLIPSWVRHDVYSSLIAGAKGIVIFSFANRKGFKSHDIYFTEYARTADELCGEMNLGQVFLFGEKRNDISLKITEGPEDLPFFFKAAGMKSPAEYPSINIFNAAFGNERYLFLVSSANTQVTVEISGFPENIAIYDIFNKEHIEISDKECMKITFKPLEVKAFKFSAKMED